MTLAVKRKLWPRALSKCFSFFFVSFESKPVRVDFLTVNATAHRVAVTTAAITKMRPALPNSGTVGLGEADAVGLVDAVGLEDGDEREASFITETEPELRAGELRTVLAKTANTLLIEDDFGGPVSGAPAISVVDARMLRWAVIRSVSKALGPDLRLAVVAGDDLTIARVEGRQRLGPRWVSHILQDAVVAMWSDAKVMRQVERASDIYALRRNALIDELAKVGIEARGRSGLNVWIPVADENAIVQSLLEDGWAVRPGAAYRVRSAPGIRVTISALKPADARRFAADFARSLRPRASTNVA